MDYHTELNMDLPTTLKTAIVGMCGDVHIAAHRPLTPVLSALESENNYQLPPDPLSGCDGFTTLETVPYSFDQTGPAAFANGFTEPPVTYTYQEQGFGENAMWSMYPHNQFGVYNQGQFNNLILPPDHESQNFPPIGYMNGDKIYEYAANLYGCPEVVSPPLELDLTKKRKRSSQPDCNRQYVKRPPNAFMIYRKEQRPHVVAETNITDCAAVNKILGQRWKMMTRKEQAKYYEEAKSERAIHAQLYPDWSAKDNYGNMPKRVRRKTAKEH